MGKKYLLDIALIDRSNAIWHRYKRIRRIDLIKYAFYKHGLSKIVPELFIRDSHYLLYDVMITKEKGSKSTDAKEENTQNP